MGCKFCIIRQGQLSLPQLDMLGGKKIESSRIWISSDKNCNSWKNLNK